MQNNMGMIMLIRTIIVFFIFLCFEETIAEIRMCSDPTRTIPEDLQEIKSFGPRLLGNEKSLNILTNYSDEFLKDIDKKFLKYDINQHLDLLLSIAQKYKLSDRQLTSFQSLTNSIIKIKLYQNNDNLSKLIVILKVRLTKNRKRFADLIYNEIENSKNIGYVNDLIGMLAQRGMTKEIQEATDQIDVKFSKEIIQMGVKKSKFIEKINKLISTNDLILQNSTEKKIKAEILKYNHSSHRNADERKYIYNPKFIFWQIHQLGINMQNNSINNIMINLEKFVSKRSVSKIRFDIDSSNKTLSYSQIFNFIKQTNSISRGESPKFINNYCN